MGHKKKIATLLAGTSLVATGLVPATGQDAGADAAAQGFALTLGIESTLRVNDNLSFSDPSPGTSTLWDNTVRFGLLSETGVARFSADLAGTIRTAAFPGQSTDTTFDDPSIVLGYQLESADSLLEAELSYRQVSLQFEDPLAGIDELIEDGLEPDDLVPSDGVRGNYGALVSFETGRTAPFGFGTVLEYDKTEYWDTTDPGNYDDETTAAEIFARLQFSPVMEGRIALDWEQYDAMNAVRTSRRTVGATASLTYEIDPITRVTASLGYSEIEETNLIGTTLQDGVTGGLSVTRDFPRGNITAEYTTDISTTGRRDTIEVQGELETPGGSITAGVGATRSNAGDVNWIGSLGYNNELAFGIVNASLERSYDTSDGGVENRSTTASLGFDTDVSPNASLGFELDYAEVTNVATGATTSVSGFRATYNRDLTANWDMIAGYEYRKRRQPGDTDRESNELFVTLEREFSIR
ncbi:hypothetical protein GCM10016455_25930 [Aliiroseovarius zhejiangensis]|uniref:Outer membrane beta-barrel protein n=1 Tax=Aliiroseovarius zhejiangensis TaxID=1632025 RepID=A0ABQ3JA03_9RHOB|nr:hypothetical protein [Aliiroseovarius zhejiangensis]GHF03450.1 hypothetical protein GCM10016455_25930 [Aliiroseovarius zhejiangensis]